MRQRVPPHLHPFRPLQPGSVLGEEGSGRAGARLGLESGQGKASCPPWSVSAHRPHSGIPQGSEPLLLSGAAGPGRPAVQPDPVPSQRGAQSEAASHTCPQNLSPSRGPQHASWPTLTLPAGPAARDMPSASRKGCCLLPSRAPVTAGPATPRPLILWVLQCWGSRPPRLPHAPRASHTPRPPRLPCPALGCHSGSAFLYKHCGCCLWPQKSESPCSRPHEGPCGQKPCTVPQPAGPWADTGSQVCPEKGDGDGQLPAGRSCCIPEGSSQAWPPG